MNLNNNSAAAGRFNAYEIASVGIAIAMVFVATAFVNIRLPIAANGGLIHLGNVPLFLTSCYLGKRTGMLAGAFGMAFFDLMGGWVLWAPFTFVIVGAIGYAFGTIYNQRRDFAGYVLAVLAALVIKIVGYYVAEGIIYGNWIAPAMSIYGNTVQIMAAAIISYPALKVLGSKNNK